MSQWQEATGFKVVCAGTCAPSAEAAQRQLMSPCAAGRSSSRRHLPRRLHGHPTLQAEAQPSAATPPVTTRASKGTHLRVCSIQS